MGRNLFQILIKLGCLAMLAMGTLVLVVALLAFIFDSSLPGTSMLYAGMSGKFKFLVLLAMASTGLSLAIYFKLPSFEDLFAGR